MKLNHPSFSIFNFSFCILSLSLALAGCDFLENRDRSRERADSDYRDAMTDYAAGRVDRAVAGLEKVVAASPDNASARFQLACLLQDVKKDYLGAICNYREFVAQDASSDKVSLAKDRIKACERLLGPELIKKYDVDGKATLADENLVLKNEVETLRKAKAELEKKLEKAQVKAEESRQETERMIKVLKGVSTEDAAKPVVASEKDLLDDLENDGREDRIKFSEDVKNLLIEEKEETSATPFAVTAAKPKAEKKEETPKEPLHEEKPSEYVVQEGDSLIKIAQRFYGRKSAWTLIRDANKTIVSTDGRVNAGQKLKLP